MYDHGLWTYLFLVICWTMSQNYFVGAGAVQGRQYMIENAYTHAKLLKQSI